jgi:hypothetical protein
MPHRPTNFRSTVVKPYYSKNLEDSDTDKATIPDITITVTPPTKKRGRGRPKGSKNKQHFTEQFITAKEKGDLELSLKLRRKGVITKPGPLF